MKKLLFLMLSLSAVSQLSAINPKGHATTALQPNKYFKPNRSSTNSCNNFGNLQTLSVGNFNVSVCANDYKFERIAVLSGLQNEIEKELGQAPKAV